MIVVFGALGYEKETRSSITWDKDIYNEYEDKLIDVITNAYIATISKKLDPLLSPDPNTKKYFHINNIGFNIDHIPMNMVNDLYTTIYGTVARICGYQGRAFGSWHKCYFNTPKLLFLEEVKQWLVNVANNPVTESLPTRMKNRKNYLHNILARPIFGPVFCQEVKAIRDSLVLMEIEIEKILCRMAAVNYINNLEASTVKLVQQILITLYHIFDNTHSASNSSVVSILKQSMNNSTILEQLIQKLLQLDEVKDIFPHVDHSTTSSKDTGKTITKTDDIVKIHSENPFLNNQGKVQEDLVSLLVKNKVSSGMEDVFQIEKCLRPLLRALALTIVLSRYCVALRELKDLAGTGGGILVYFIMGRYILTQIHAQKALSKELQKLITELYTYSEFIVDFNIDKPIGLSKQWQLNYIALISKKGILEELFLEIEERMNALEKSINYFMKNPEKAIQDLKQKIADYGNQYYKPLIKQTLQIVHPETLDELNVEEKQVLTDLQAVYKLEAVYKVEDKKHPQIKSHL